MRRKILLGIVLLILSAIVARFVSINVVVFGWLAFGAGFLIGRRQGAH
jgi:hypothetical protein